MYYTLMYTFMSVVVMIITTCCSPCSMGLSQSRKHGSATMWVSLRLIKPPKPDRCTSLETKQLCVACRPPLILAVQSRPVSFPMIEVILKARKLRPQVVDEADKAGTTALGYAMQHILDDKII